MRDSSIHQISQSIIHPIAQICYAPGSKESFDLVTGWLKIMVHRAGLSGRAFIKSQHTRRKKPVPIYGLEHLHDRLAALCFGNVKAAGRAFHTIDHALLHQQLQQLAYSVLTGIDGGCDLFYTGMLPKPGCQVNNRFDPYFTGNAQHVSCI